VPDVLFRTALDRIRNSVVNAEEPEKDGAAIAYGLYVLAKNGTAPIGDLRYLADTKLNNIATPIAKAQLAAALALVGDRARAERVYAAAVNSLAPKPAPEFGRMDYGSSCAMRRRWFRCPARATRRRRRSASRSTGRSRTRPDPILRRRRMRGWFWRRAHWPRRRTALR
jgi:hypothetical protein